MFHLGQLRSMQAKRTSGLAWKRLRFPVNVSGPGSLALNIHHRKTWKLLVELPLGIYSRKEMPKRRNFETALATKRFCRVWERGDIYGRAGYWAATLKTYFLGQLVISDMDICVSPRSRRIFGAYRARG